MRSLAAWVALALAPVALGGDVQVAVYQVEMSHEGLSGLLAEGLPDAKLFEKVRGMVVAKTVTLRDLSLIRLRPGEKATFESIREVTYPTEYEPDKWDLNARMPLTEEGLKKMQEQWRREAFAASFFPVFGGTLHGFETRNVGVTLEVEVGGDSQGFGWQLEKVAHVRDSIMGQTLGLDGKPRVQRMPNFDTMRLRGGTLLAKGVTLAAVTTPVAADGSLAKDRKILVFVKADVLETK